MSYDEWLESLKPGDKVLLLGSGFRTVRKIDRITPTGRIVLMGLKSHFIDGRHRIDTYNSERIEEFTAEKEAEFRLSMKLQKIKHYTWDKTDSEKINAVYDILFGKE